MTNFIVPMGVILITFLLTLGLTAWVRRLLLSHALLDHPNERSSHTLPVPRGGGWALIIVILGALSSILFLNQVFSLTLVGLLSGCLLLVYISWRDDRQSVSPAMRLSCHIVAACLGSLAFSSDQMIFSDTLPFWLDRLIMILGWAWFMNLYNFMDGIDGITSVETITLATGSCLLLSATGLDIPYMHFLSLILTGTCLGFLCFNWHPAKIFLGDIGSVPLGFMTGFLLLSFAVHGYLISALIMPLYYLADSGITLMRRALKGEKIWQAHRQHFYQQAVQRLIRHDLVIYRIIAANLVLLALAILAVTLPWVALPLAIVVVAILLGWMHKINS